MINVNFLSVLLFIFLNLSKCQNEKKITIRMPKVQPNIPEEYLCTSVKIDNDNYYYIVGFEPNATTTAAHHILLFGCSEPGSTRSVWNCGKTTRADNPTMNTAGPCKAKSKIIYGSSADAAPLNLPDGVGFKVGKNSNVKYLVLRVHYPHDHQLKEGSTDESGIVLQVTNRSLTKLAGVYLLGTGGGIPPRSVEHMEVACTMYENTTLHPFNYVVHTHSLGKVVSGYVIKNSDWIELGKTNPVAQKNYYNIHYNGTINQGDIVAARCTMQSERDKWTYIGTNDDDEMCNFYFMYYVENGKPLDDQSCISAGPPKYYWHSGGLTNIPDEQASML